MNMNAIRYIEPAALHDEMLRLRQEEQMDFLECLTGMDWGEAFVLLQSLQVPFRAPLEPSLCSLDRFWLLRGSRLFVPLCGVAFSVGLFLARNWHFELYVFLLVGFLLALALHTRRKLFWSVVQCRNIQRINTSFCGIWFIADIADNFCLGDGYAGRCWFRLVFQPISFGLYPCL